MIRSRLVLLILILLGAQDSWEAITHFTGSLDNDWSKAGAELLFEAVSRAYERTSLLVTTNLPFENWTEVMGKERLTGALLDGLTHRIHILEANGESYRLREFKRRHQRRRSPKSKTNSQ